MLSLSSPSARHAAALILVLLPGCGPHAVATAFSRDHGCPVSKVQRRGMYKGTWRVWGCEKEAVYSCAHGACTKQNPEVAAARPAIAAPVNVPNTYSALPTINFYTGNAFSKVGSDKNVVKNLDGTVWVFERYAMILVPDDMLVIEDGPDSYRAMINNQWRAVAPVSGFVSWDRAQLGKVVRSLGDGAVLQLHDGSLWEVESYDHYHTGYWLPPYPVLIDGYRMLNLNRPDDDWIHVSPAQ